MESEHNSRVFKLSKTSLTLFAYTKISAEKPSFKMRNLGASLFLPEQPCKDSLTAERPHVAVCQTQGSCLDLLWVPGSLWSMVRGHIPVRTTSCRSLRVHLPLREEGDQPAEVLLVIMRVEGDRSSKKTCSNGTE